MTGIYGYLNMLNNGDSSTTPLEDMGARLADGQGVHIVSFSDTPGSGIAAIAPHAGAHNDETLQAAYEGRPHWSNTELATLAHERGHTQAIVEAYRRFGIRFLKHLHGPFAIAVLEPGRDRALLAIDRIGIRSLAFTHHENSFVFASRTDALLAHPTVKRELSLQALFNYLYFHVVPSPATIYENIEKLLPGQYVVFEAGKLKRDFYWQPAYTEKTAAEPQLAEELRTKLEHAICDCMDDTPTGTFLSGGLDSSTVTGMFARLSERTVDAYAIGFQADGYDEMEYARVSARHFGVRLHEYYVTPDDVVQTIPLIAQTYDEPFANASAVPAYHCARIAKEDGKTCLLAGDGGDEIFAGNARYAKQKLFDLYFRIPETLRQYVIESITFHFPWGERLPALRKLKSYIEQARIPMPDRMETYNFLHRTPLAKVLHSDFLAAIDPNQPLEHLREVYARTSSSSLLKRMLHLDLKITLADNDLRKVNRMCDLAGIDVRYPMLQENLVDFSASVPSKLLLRGFELRSFYRQALSDFLAPKTLEKNKQGFGLPFGLWMTEHSPLQELAYDSLTQLKQRKLLNPAYLDQLIGQHRTGHAAYYGVMIWVLMMLEQWLQAHNP